ncbi:MAG: TrmB family transcriptional regulator [Candidatus Aenigmarchaeota archaeon]|nr:TrmB family transcriptional regulator [Candidatus Aenigmarchaeota archaeon]
MVVATAKTMDALRTIGLNKYERNLWAALLSRGSATAGELSDISNVPRSRCYDVLESLAARGFVVVQPGKPLKYVAISPKEALDRAKKKVVEEAHEVSAKIDRLAKSDSLRELEKLFKENIKTVKPEDLTGALKGRQAMHQQLESMLKKAKKSVKLMTTETGLVEISEQHGSILKKAADAGVKIMIAAPVTKGTEAVAKEMSRYAQIHDIDDVEYIERVAGRLCVVDSQEFLVGLTDDTKVHPTQDVSFWTQSDHVTANMFEPMFELVWKHSKPVK